MATPRKCHRIGDIMEDAPTEKSKQQQIKAQVISKNQLIRRKRMHIELNKLRSAPSDVVEIN